MVLNRGNGRKGWPPFAELFATLWIATLVIAATVYLGSIDQLSSDAVAVVLGSVLSLAGADMIQRRATHEANVANGKEKPGP